MSATAATGIDCHAHVIDPDRFPFADGPGYRPRADEHGNRESYAEVLRANGMSHAVLVQPSCYGFDNQAMVEAIARSGGCWRGIAVVPDDVTESTLDELSSQGIVGARINLGAFDSTFFERAGASAWLARMRARKWVVQVYGAARHWSPIAPRLLDSGATIIVDHLGHPDTTAAIEQPGFAAVLELGRSQTAYAKLSAPFRSARQSWPYADLVPFARAVLAAFGVERCLFGSDWPFVNAAKSIAYSDQLRWLEHLIPDDAQRRTVLVDNPARLFRFTGNAPA